MTRRILASYLLMTFLVLVMLGIPLGLNFARGERDRLLTAIERDSRVLAAEADDAFENGEFDAIPVLVESYVQQTGGRVVMVDANGRSVIDSDDPTGPPRDFSTRPEVAAALEGKYTTGERVSSTLGESLSFVAVPISHEGSVLGVVRVSYPTTTVDQRTREVWIQLAALGAIVLVVVGVVGWFVARTLSRPIRALETAAGTLAAGDLTARVPIDHGPDDLVQVGRTFNTMADRLQSLVESQQSFLADASHQLRTPLTALRLRLESLAARDAGDLGAAGAAGDRDDDITAITAEVDRLSELVGALLAMARLDALTGTVVTIDLAEVVSTHLATWRPLSDENAVEISLELPGTPVPVAAVAGAIEQVLDNLIANALDVAPRGTSITVTVEPGDASWTRLSVTDEGPGMTDAQIARAFDRFWRGPSPSEGGSGLGLAIVRRLVEASGGRVRIERSEAGGLSAIVDLPVRVEVGGEQR